MQVIKVQKKANVQLLSQFFLGSTANEIKTLMLHSANGYGSAKPYYKQRDGKKQLKRLIYHLIVAGIIKEEMAGTSERPTVLLTVGNAESLMDSKQSILF